MVTNMTTPYLQSIKFEAVAKLLGDTPFHFYCGNLVSAASVSDEQITAGMQVERDADAMRKLRTKRNEVLASTDFHVIIAFEKGTPIPPDIVTYRQTLRDLPETVGTAQVDDDGTLITPIP